MGSFFADDDDSAPRERLAKRLGLTPRLPTDDPTDAPASDGLFLIDAAGQIAPLDLDTITHTDRALRLNQRFARLCQVPDGTLERIKIEHELRRALERKEFEVYLQPQAAIGTNQIVGAEALVRWRHPERGIIEPDDFVQVAEESGLIIELGEQVLRTACEEAVSREKAGLPLVRIAVNISAIQFREPSLTQRVAAVLDETGLDPRMLDLEITESAAMRHAALAVDIIHDLASLGVTISLDDFGRGYSSLEYLREFPIHALKIDRSFMRGVPAEADDAAIVEAIIAIGNTFGLRVIAEGIETAGQLAFLRERGCGWYQGFLLGRPMPTEAFNSMIRRQAA